MNRGPVVRICILGLLLGAASGAWSDGRPEQLPELSRELPELEFRNEPLANAFLAIGDLAGMTIVTDATVSGSVSQVLKPMPAAAALEALAAARGVFWWTDDEVIRVSRVRVDCPAGDEGLTLSVREARVGAVARAVAAACEPPLLFDTLPQGTITLREQDATVSEIARLLVSRHPRYVVDVTEAAVHIRDTSRRTRPGGERRLDVSRSAAGFAVRAHGVSLGEALSRLFSTADREYVLLAAADRELRDVSLSGHGFDALLERLLAGVHASFDRDGGTYYIYDVEERAVIAGLERSVRHELRHITVAELEGLLPSELLRGETLRLDERQGSVVIRGRRAEVTAALRFLDAVDRPHPGREYRRFDLDHADVEAVLASLPERFGRLGAVRVPGANGFVARIPRARAGELARYLALLDREPGARVVRLRYIRAAELLRHLPPEVDRDHVHTTPDPRVVMLSGPPRVHEALDDALSVVDRPVPQVRYQLLVVQYRQGRSVEWRPHAENARMQPGDSTVLLGRVGELLSLDFDVVTALGYRFAVELSHRISRDEARVLADTTLNGVSGRRVEFRNTDTFRYRDTRIDPDTGEPESLGVTREITSGLVVGIEGWSSGDDMITMDISATLSRRGTDVSEEGTNPPPTSERLVDTRVRTPSGRPVVIGGLIQQDVSRSERRTPILGALPLVGALFRGTTRSVEESELVLYVLPVVEEGRGPVTVSDRLHGHLDRIFEEADR